MNKLLTLALVIFCLKFGFSQTAPPQAVCYQAVATDIDGREIMNATMSIRATIISGNAAGNEIYIETFNPVQTDDFGLFTINIGEGNQTGGSVASFSDIKWGIDNYFLKIELDPIGGNNFIEMGTSQILSVPYALFSRESVSAETAQSAIVADSASFASTSDYAITSENAVYAQNAGLADSALVAVTAIDDLDKDPLNELQELVYDGQGNLGLTGTTNTVFVDVNDGDNNPTNEIQSLEYDGSTLTLTGPGGGSSVSFEDFLFRSPGASFDYPQGILGDHEVLTMGVYTVPPGTNFYLTGSEESILFSHPNVNNGELVNHPTTPNMPVLPEGTTLNNCKCTGLLTPIVDYIEPVIIDLSDPNIVYIVPPGKVLFIKSGVSNDSSGYLKVNGIDIEFFRPNLSRWSRILSFPENTILKRPEQPLNMEQFVLTAYLIDAE